MKKLSRILTVFVVVFALLCSGTPFANAAVYQPEDDETVSPNADLILPPHLKDDETGGSILYTEIFTVTAAEVHDHLYSNAGSKRFTLSSLPSSSVDIYLSGTLFHSVANETTNYRMYVGICYYDGSLGEYVSVFEEEVFHGVFFDQDDISISIETLEERLPSSSTTLYTYIENNHPGGTTYVWGELTVGYSKEI